MVKIISIQFILMIGFQFNVFSQIIEDVKIDSTEKYGIFKDKRDGKIYKTVKIGEQIWMAENLKFKAKKGCWAYNRTESYSEYGYYYDYKVVQNVCPENWRLPNRSDYEKLLIDFGGIGSKESFFALLPNGKSGFSATLFGYGLSNGLFLYNGFLGCFWGIEENNPEKMFNLFLMAGAETTGFDSNDYKFKSNNVRCIKNE